MGSSRSLRPARLSVNLAWTHGPILTVEELEILHKVFRELKVFGNQPTWDWTQGQVLSINIVPGQI